MKQLPTITDEDIQNASLAALIRESQLPDTVPSWFDATTPFGRYIETKQDSPNTVGGMVFSYGVLRAASERAWTDGTVLEISARSIERLVGLADHERHFMAHINLFYADPRTLALRAFYDDAYSGEEKAEHMNGAAVTYTLARLELKDFE